METKRRTLLKTVTCKILEVTTSGLIVQLIFGQPVISIGLPLLLEGLQMFGYFIHERVWNRINGETGVNIVPGINRS